MPISCITIAIHLWVIMFFSGSLMAQEIIFPPNTPICTLDIDLNGSVSSENEIDSCGTGQLYNPITDLPGPAIANSCPLGKTACERLERNVCSIDSTECGEFDASCTRPLSCAPTVWSEDGGPDSLTYRPSQTGYFCPSNGNTYDTEPEVISACRLMDEIIDEVTFEDIRGGGWLCLRTGIIYPVRQDAINACTYIGDIGVAPYNTVIQPEGWYCSNNGIVYPDEASGVAGCRITNTINGFDCPTTPFNDRYLTEGACQAACEQTGSCAIETGLMACPLGNFQCINDAPGSEAYSCSPSICARFEDEGEYTPPVDTFTPNDGTVSVDGECLDQVQIFNGKAETCRLPGIASAYQNCCNEASEDMLTDSSGSLSETVAWAQGINALYDASAAAYAAYSAATAGGAGTGAAAGSSASAFQGSLVQSLGSTTMVVAVVIVAITAYLENACPPEGVVTAIKKKSKQCVTIGNICTTKFLGSCVQEREVNCCFNSLMATLVQVGGRQQLGMDFGTPEAPNCRGFTPDEFQSIDFSKIDLTDYYSEIETRAQGDIENEITTVITDTADGI